MQFNFLLITLLFALSAAALSSDSEILDDGSVEIIPALEANAQSAPSPNSKARRRRRHLNPRLAPVNNGTPVACDPVSTTGVIKVHADGSLLGYISQKFNPINLYTLTTDLPDALMFLLPTQHFNTAIDITALAGPSAVGPLLGSVGSNAFGKGQSGFSYLAGVTHTDAGMPPSSIAATSLQALGHNMPSESQIWTMKCSLDISAQWINPTGSRAPTTIFYDPVANFLGLTGDVTSLGAAYPKDNVIAVSFTFVPA